jgi:hypothetical protein
VVFRSPLFCFLSACHRGAKSVMLGASRRRPDSGGHRCPISSRAYGPGTTFARLERTVKFYKHDPDRFLNGVAELNFEQRGAYYSLVDLLYCRDGLVVDDDVTVARMLRCQWRVWRRLKAQLMALEKIWCEDGVLHANGVDDTLKEAAYTSDQQKLRALKRWRKHPSKNGKTPDETTDPSMQRGNAIHTHSDREIKKEGVPTDHALPPTWKPNSDHLLLADQLGLTPAQVTENAEEMKAWAWGNGRTRSNWNFMFSSWLRRKAKNRSKTNGHTEIQPTIVDVNRQLLEQIRSGGTLLGTNTDPVRMLSQDRRK